MSRRRSRIVMSVLVAMSLGATACARTEVTQQSSEGLEASDAYPGFVVEPAGEIGPNAFTAPVTTDDASICDKAKLLRELQDRPDAHREWARVLGVAEADVPAYVASLQPRVLDTDTPVTNHGLADGVAYPRLSVLTAGTAVLVDETRASATYLPPQEVTTTTTTTTTTTSTRPPTTTGPPENPPPVTRCRCGNPLLPPPLPPETSTSTSSASTSTTPQRRSSGGATTPTEATTSTKPAVVTPTDPEPPGGPTDDEPPGSNDDQGTPSSPLPG